MSSFKAIACLAAMVVTIGSVTSAAHAATDGSLGATSTGSVAINASVPSRARISGLSDIDFTNSDPTSAPSDAQDVCVWSNTSGGSYTITASGDPADGFVLKSGIESVAYSVEWADVSGQTSGTALSSGTQSATFASTATHHSCTTGPAASASLIVSMTSADLQTMAAGSTYTGTLTLLVSPI